MIPAGQKPLGLIHSAGTSTDLAKSALPCKFQLFSDEDLTSNLTQLIFSWKHVVIFVI